jgi:hypothetical protein
MIDNTVSFVTRHPNVSYCIDLGVKLGALFLGGIWTYWNSRKSRTYAQKLDLQLSGDVFFKDDLYVDVSIILTNFGAAKHILQPEGTSCEIVAVQKDLSHQSIRLFPVFALHTQIEPGEAISDHVLWRIMRPLPDIVWLKIDLRVVSGKVEWNTTSVVRVGDEPANQ